MIKRNNQVVVKKTTIVNKNSKSRNNNGGNYRLVAKKKPITKSISIIPNTRRIVGKETKKGIVVTVSHVEYIRDLITPIDYNGGYIQFGISVNPGLKSIFPWLSNMSQSFESYSMKSISFMFKPTLGTIASGSIMACAQYDIHSAAPEGKYDFLQNDSCVEKPIHEPLIFPLNKGKGGINNQKSYKLRTGTSTDVGDKELYDCANVFLAFNGITSGTGTSNSQLYIGELWVSYVVDFLIPIGRTSKIQLNNIETIMADAVGSGLTVSTTFPLGLNLIKRMSGKLLTAGLKYIEQSTGNYTGHLFSSSKSICKLVRMISNGLGVTVPATPALKFIEYKNTSTLDENGGELPTFIFDGQELVDLFNDTNNDDEIVTFDTSTPIWDGTTLADQGINIITNMTDGVARLTEWLIRTTGPVVIQLTGTGSNPYSVGSAFMMTDFSNDGGILKNAIAKGVI